MLSEKDFKDLTEAYARLMKIIAKVKQAESERSSRNVKLNTLGSLGPTESNANLSVYQLLSKEADVLDTDMMVALTNRLSESLSCLDSGGKAFMLVANSSNLLAAMKSWLIVLDVWGSCLNTPPLGLVQNREVTAERLTKCEFELRSLVAECEFLKNPTVVSVCNDITVLVESFAKLVEHLADSQSVISEAPEQPLNSRASIDYSRAGYLLPLNCGHSGPFSSIEKSAYKAHLLHLGFLSLSS
jgi:hypothetical protein